MSHSLSQIIHIDVMVSYVPTKEMGGGSDSSTQQVQSFISAKRKKKMVKKSSEILSKQRLINHV